MVTTTILDNIVPVRVREGLLSMDRACNSIIMYYCILIDFLFKQTYSQNK